MDPRTILRNLPPYQKRVIKLATQGWSDKAIARQLGRTPSSVAVALNQVYEKLNLTDPLRITHPRIIATAMFRTVHPNTGFAR